MAFPEGVHGQLAVRFEVLLPHLNERQRRLMCATEARLLGHGGIRAVARAAKVSETTVRRGVLELESDELELSEGRVRRPGGGRKRAEEVDSGVLPALMALVEPDERGDPMSPLRWTTKSLRSLAQELTRQGHPVSAMTVGRLLKENGFSLQAQAKMLEGKQHPDRDGQFRYINDQVKHYQADGEPVISVDTKKKEMLGQLPNVGRQWRPKGDPVQAEDHSFFTGPKGDAAIPYGIFDLTADTGWVNVGVDHDTSTFAVASIRRWWQARGHHDYPHATRLLITADAGGSNSYRYRVWKSELAAFAAETGLAITVCHFPPGTSKWNKVEHRLFSHIAMNWRGRPLTSHEVVVKTIAATRTRTGLQVEAELDPGSYPTGTTVSKAYLDSLPIEQHPERGTWNYTIHPDGPAPSEHEAVRRPGETARTQFLEMLADPLLTGMTREELAALSGRLAPAQAAQREERCYQHRGGRRRKAPGDHGRALLTGPDKVLITVLYLRQVCSQKVLYDMLALSDRTISKAIGDTRRLLDDAGTAVGLSAVRFTKPDHLVAFLHTGMSPTEVRPALPEQLCDPALTGMSRADLHALIDQLSKRQAALVERRRFTQRGGHRQPGTRAGVFRQKITDAERVLATVLMDRKVCTGGVLTELFQITRGTLTNAFRDVRPLLEEDGITFPPASVTHRTVKALLASTATKSNTPTQPTT
ncbi:ISAzo13 family transposase [Streptomyces sp. NPDC007905]|uniref:ISAzo13 family transposase n=1 Tax=Streptomyces sp. NPDC007905 TaxID=3364788 RepID=UPI0036E6D768